MDNAILIEMRTITRQKELPGSAFANGLIGSGALVGSQFVEDQKNGAVGIEL